MIRVRISDQSHIWLMPHRILSVSRAWVGADSYPRLVGTVDNTFHLPRQGLIRYHNDSSCPDIICTVETPEQIAELVTNAMRFVSVAPHG